MPELPEAESCCRNIQPAVGRKIVAVDVQWSQRPELQDLKTLDWKTIGPIIGIHRRAKRIVFCFDVIRFVSKLGMSGFWDFEDEPWTFDYVEGKRTSGAADVRLRFALDDDRVLRYHDARKFGRFELVTQKMMDEIGPEPIDTPHLLPRAPRLNGTSFIKVVGDDPRPLKTILMDQRLIAGIGNIYANEALHLSGFDPRMTGEQAFRSTGITGGLRLWHAICDVLSTNLGGITYDWLKVYRRHACGTCGENVIRTEIAKRATFHCLSCQETS